MDSKRESTPQRDPRAESATLHRTGSEVTSVVQPCVPPQSPPDPRHAYKPFNDPKSQIRLIQRCLYPNHTFSFKSSIWHVEDAPPYCAISYTWGDLDETTIVLDGTPMKVRRNARYALHQLLLQRSSSYIWIDSVCIDQNNEQEKGAQVARMFNIYEEAEEVNVCLGPHADDSEWMMALAGALQPLFSGLVDQYNLGYKDFKFGSRIGKDEVWKCIAQALSKSDISRLGYAMSRLADRSYWSRVWIGQELAASRREVRMLCGHNSAGAIALYLLAGVLDYARPTVTGVTMQFASSDMQYNLGNMSSGRNNNEGLGQTISMCSGLLCSDVRDRLYAKLGLIRWEIEECDPILPDYSTSPWDLAVKLATLLDFYLFRSVLHAFELCHRHERMLAAMSRLQSQSPNMSIGQLTSGGMAMVSVRSPQLFCTRLGPLHFWDQDALSTAEVRKDFDQGLRSALAGFKGVETPKCHFAKGCVALLCPGALEDDVLVVFGGHNTYVVLVLRRRCDSQERCDIIGQGVLISRNFYQQYSFESSESCECCTSGKSRHTIFKADVCFDLTAEEAVVLVGQDVGDPGGFEYDPKARLDRVFIPPTLKPKGAAQISN